MARQPSGSYESMCAGKDRHPTRDDARRAANKMRFLSDGDRLNVYRCVWCQFFHFGHISPAQLRRQRSGKSRRRDAWATA